jgi:hypothetical protein
LNREGEFIGESKEEREKKYVGKRNSRKMRLWAFSLKKKEK